MDCEEGYVTGGEWYSSEEENEEIEEIQNEIEKYWEEDQLLNTPNMNEENEDEGESMLREKEIIESEEPKELDIRMMKGEKEKPREYKGKGKKIIRKNDQQKPNIENKNSIGISNADEENEQIGACGKEADGYWVGGNINIPKKNQKKNEDYYEPNDMEVDLEQFISQEIDANFQIYNDLEYLEETIDLNKLDIDRENRYKEEEEFPMNSLIPSKYKWTEFDEYCMGICRPSLEKKMKELRTRNEIISEREIIELHAEIEEAKLMEYHKIEKGKLTENIEKLKKKIEKTMAALRIAIQERKIAETHVRRLIIELEAKEEELVSERIYSSRKENIIEAWMRGNKESEREVIRARQENKSLLQEISQLRLTIQEMKKQDKEKQ